MKRGALQNSKKLLISLGLIAGLLTSIPVPEAQATNDLQSPCVIGSSVSCPAQSPQEIYNLYGTTTNGTYWLNVNGTATQTYLVMDTNYPDGGQWFLGMKGTKSSSNFNYSSTYWTSQTTTLNTSSLSNDVTTDAKFDAFNYLPVTKVVGVFKDRDSYAFNTSGSGVLGTNSFGGHTWKEDISSQNMFTRFTSNSILYSSTGTMTRYDLYRETNSSSGKLVFAYQNGYAKYGFTYNNGGATYRWGVAFNNETDDPRIDSSDAQAGIGLSGYGAASVYTYADAQSYSINGGTGLNNGATATYPSGFQIWGKMSAPSLATPGAITLSNQGNGNVQLSFAASSGATEYAIQYKTAGSNWNTGTTYRLTNPGATPTAVIPGIAQGSYDFRVFARATNNSSGGNSYLLAQTIDSTAPTVSSIALTSSSGSDNIYGLGDTVTVSVGWSETVTVTGSPRIQMQGLSSKYLTYISGSGTPTTLFSYVVTNGDLDRDGFSISANSLALNSGTIDDLTGNDAILTHNAISATSAMQIDGVPPTLSSASISASGARITLTFSETISSTISSYSAITLMVGATRDVLSNGSTTDARLSMSLTFSALSGSAATVSYIDPSAGNDVSALQDEAGNDLASFSSVAVTNSSTLTSNTTATILLNPASTSAVFRAVTSVKVTTNTDGKVTFLHNGKVIAGCRNLATTSSSPYYATCSWKPSVQNFVNLKAQFLPSGAGFTNTTSDNLLIYVTRRAGLR
jgi:hypothetical protein